MASITKANLPAGLDLQTLERIQRLRQYIHHKQLVGEGDNNVEATRVESNREGFLGHLVANFEGL